MKGILIEQTKKLKGLEVSVSSMHQTPTLSRFLLTKELKKISDGLLIDFCKVPQLNHIHTPSSLVLLNEEGKVVWSAVILECDSLFLGDAPFCAGLT